MLSFLARCFRSLAPIFRPPFDGLWLAVLLYYFWCFVVHPHSQMLRGNLPDPDDYMYLNQVLDWLKGHGWYDAVQHRFDPPVGSPVHFSRLTQIPMAAIILLFRLCGLPWVGAATLTAMIEPLFLFAGFLLGLRWVMEIFVPKNWAGSSSYVALFATGVLAMFTPGHVDHHGLVVLLVTLSFGCALRMMTRPAKIMWGIGAGALLGLTMVVALEVLPWLILITAWLGLWSVVEGKAAARNALGYGLALYLTNALLLLISRPPELWLVPAIPTYSIVYVFFTASIAAIFAGIALAAHKPALWRWAIAGGLAGSTAWIFLSHFPELSSGPMGGANQAVASLILDNVSEATPLAKLKGGGFKTVIAMLEPLLALAAGVWFLLNARKNEKWAWSLACILLVAALLLTVFYQYRFVGMLDMFAIVPLSAALHQSWRWIGEHWRERRKVFAELGLLLLVGPLPSVLVPALMDGRSFSTGVLLFPVHNDASAVCDMYGLEHVLRAPQIYDGHPKLIINTMGLGPELLFRSPHNVLSAPFHDDVEGNLDAVRFFSATDLTKAEAVARRRDAGLVVLCKLIPGMYTDLTAVHAALPDMNAGATVATNPSPPLILRLITGQDLPGWLLPVHSSQLGNYVVYEISFAAKTNTKTGATPERAKRE